MTTEEKTQRILSMLKQVANKDALEVVADGLETMEAPAPVRAGSFAPDAVRGNIQNLIDREAAELTDDDIFVAEAIIIPDKRPPAFIRKGTYDDFTGDWAHLNSSDVRGRLNPAIASVGRLEMPKQQARPYAGTGFVVGQNLLMTNRHVASLFSTGLGSRGLLYQPGSAAIDLLKEVDTTAGDRSLYLEVSRVVMIHPYWDMAVIEVQGLDAKAKPLPLSVAPPEQLNGQDVAAIGYPAFDPRNDVKVQNTVFGNVFEVKRIQPGKLLERGQRMSFRKLVSAVTHDCSTLGGNSGSAVVDVQTGQVVGLHFSGDYLKANYAVPTYELARDSRVVDAGVNFFGSVPPTSDWEDFWKELEQESPPTNRGAKQSSQDSSTSTTWIVPIRVTVSLGGAMLEAASAPVPATPALEAAGEESFQIPIIHGDLESRRGYDPAFLGLANGEAVPLPTLTGSGRNVAASLEDGSRELKYHRFTIVMHKVRRLAMFTAANVDWRTQSRLINGHKPTRAELSGIPDGVLEEWATDPRIPSENQLPDVFFTQDRQAFDKGHIVRRDDVTWGATFDDMQKSNGDTYHTTNCSPQVKQFNQASLGVDNWGDLESLIEKQTNAEKAIVLGGPVLNTNDRRFFGVSEQGQLVVRIPSKFWKIVVVKTPGGPRAFGFMLKQNLSNVDFGVEFIVSAPWKRYLVPISEIESALHGWATLDWFKRFDQIDSEESTAIAETLDQ